ncbi:MAG: hypothetical protein MJZ24_10725 [Paludibacteraceae bacterium]|nr:hypothetical protein [Candidatus Physcocola equi]MCQ2235197.1 hypothetical protein [Paludibacteraceae bacterium]
MKKTQILAVALLCVFCCSNSAFARKKKESKGTDTVSADITPAFFRATTYEGRFQQRWHGFSDFSSSSQVTLINYNYTFQFGEVGNYVTITYKTTPQFSATSPSDHSMIRTETFTLPYTVKDGLLIIDSFAQFKIKGHMLISDHFSGDSFPLKLHRR